MKSCSTCSYRWIKPANFVTWYCRIPGKPLKLIGGDVELKLSKGCNQWRK